MSYIAVTNMLLHMTYMSIMARRLDTGAETTLVDSEVVGFQMNLTTFAWVSDTELVYSNEEQGETVLYAVNVVGDKRHL
jgi:hypothetical protein